LLPFFVKLQSLEPVIHLHKQTEEG
jgi:hypothetical protein